MIHFSARRRSDGSQNLLPYPVEDVMADNPSHNACMELKHVKSRESPPPAQMPSKETRRNYTREFWEKGKELPFFKEGINRRGGNGFRHHMASRRRVSAEGHMGHHTHTRDDLKYREHTKEGLGFGQTLIAYLAREHSGDVNWRFPVGGTNRSSKRHRAIGVEIEFSGDESDGDDIDGSLPHCGRLGEDCSVHGYGHEVRVLTCEKYMKKHVRSVCEVINRYNHETRNVGAGLHVHLDSRAMATGDAQQMAARLFVWLITLQGFIPSSRRNANYARQQFGGERYNMVHTYQIDYKGTVEIRMHSATTNATKIIQWVELLLAIEKTPFPWRLFANKEYPDLGEVFKPLSRKLGIRRSTYWKERYALFNQENQLTEGIAPLSRTQIIELGEGPGFKRLLRKEVYARQTVPV